MIVNKQLLPSYHRRKAEDRDQPLSTPESPLEEEDKEILKGLTLDVPAGEVAASRGPDGSGKATLSYVLAGRDGYEVDGGEAALQRARRAPRRSASDSAGAPAGCRAP